jgi:serine acetyltransferase
MVVPLRSADDEPRILAANIQEVVTPVNGGGWFHYAFELQGDERIAHVSFTSGTEGAPKGVFLSARALIDVIFRLQSVMQMDDSVREYVGVPVYHSFGYGRCRHVASVGGQFYIPESGFDPKELSAMLSQGEVNALSLVPSLLRTLIDTPALLGDERLRLKWLEIGSQAMSAEEKRRVCDVFPNACIVQHYGLTEASRSTLLKIDGAKYSELNSVGKPYGDTQLMVNNEGVICIRGSHLASYIMRDGELLSLLNAHEWFETSDIGELDSAGDLFFKGRVDNVVNCGGQKLSTERLYSAITAAYLKANDDLSGEMAVSRIEHALYGEGFLVACTDTILLDAIKRVAADCLRDLGVNAKGAIHYYCIDALPKTATGKVQNKQLSIMYAQSVLASQVEVGSQCDMQVFADILGVPVCDVNEDDSVIDIGVDSLQSVQLSIQLEKALGYLPANWRYMPIREWLTLPQHLSEHMAASSDERANHKAAPLWDGSSNRNPSDVGFWSLVKEDFHTHDSDIFSQGLFALFVNRLGNWRMGIRSRWLRFPMTVLYRVFIKMAQIVCGIKLDYTVQVGRRVKLEHFGAMILGARSIGDDTIIRQNTTFGIREISDLAAKPIIEQGVNIGAGAVIVGDITIGRHSVIGPNCVITDDVPPFSVVSIGAMVVNHASVPFSDHES